IIKRLKLGGEGSTLCEATDSERLFIVLFCVTVGNDVNYSKLEGRTRFAAIAIGVLMFEHVPISRRRALLGAAGALVFQRVLQPMTASSQTTPGSKVKIGVIGAGHIGGTIGGLWIKAGHPVFLSSRHPEELQDLVARLGPLAQAGTVEQAI